jgi:hypothetical protein
MRKARCVVGFGRGRAAVKRSERRSFSESVAGRNRWGRAVRSRPSERRRRRRTSDTGILHVLRTWCRHACTPPPVEPVCLRQPYNSRRRASFRPKQVSPLRDRSERTRRRWPTRDHTTARHVPFVPLVVSLPSGESYRCEHCWLQSERLCSGSLHRYDRCGISCGSRHDARHQGKRCESARGSVAPAHRRLSAAVNFRRAVFRGPPVGPARLVRQRSWSRNRGSRSDFLVPLRRPVRRRNRAFVTDRRAGREPYGMRHSLPDRGNRTPRPCRRRGRPAPPPGRRRRGRRPTPGRGAARPGGPGPRHRPGGAWTGAAASDHPLRFKA